VPNLSAMPALTDRSWLWVASCCYLTGFLMGLFSLLRDRRDSQGVIYFIITAGYVLQTFGLYLRGLAVKGCPLGNNFEIFQFTAWSAITLYLVIGATFRLSLLGFFTCLLTTTLTTLSLAFPSWDAVRRVGIFGGNAWVEAHAALALFSYGVFALLALTSVMFLLRHYSLKHKRLSGAFTFLPSILDLDQIGLRLIGFGAGLLFVALAIGSVHWLPNPHAVNTSKLLTTVAVASAYAATLVLRLTGRLVARRFAWAGVVLFGAALLSLPVVNASRRDASDVHPTMQVR
jgi:HemX protein